MTPQDWLLVEVGDMLVDPHTGARREILHVSRCKLRNSRTRTVVTVPGLKRGAFNKHTTTIWSTDGARQRCLVLEKRAMSGAIEFRDPGDEQP